MSAKIVCVFGDSITHGADDFGSGGWVGRLQREFDTEENWTVFYNLGIPGDTSEGLLNRFENELVPRKPDVIVIAIGINDTKWIRSAQSVLIPESDFRKNITELLLRAKSHTPYVLVVGLIRIDQSRTIPAEWNSDKEFHNETIEQYDAVLKELAKANEVKYVDVSTAITPEDVPYDGVHPDAKGHQKLFERILPEVHKLV